MMCFLHAQVNQKQASCMQNRDCLGKQVVCVAQPRFCAVQVAVCKEQVEWAIAEKRTFLRQRIQLRLASLYLDTAEYQEALKIVGT